MQRQLCKHSRHLVAENLLPLHISHPFPHQIHLFLRFLWCLAFLEAKNEQTEIQPLLGSPWSLAVSTWKAHLSWSQRLTEIWYILTLKSVNYLQPPAIWKCMAKFPLLLLEIKMEANPCFPLNNIKFSLLPYILHILIIQSTLNIIFSTFNYWILTLMIHGKTKVEEDTHVLTRSGNSYDNFLYDKRHYYFPTS